MGHEGCDPGECEVSAVYALLGRARDALESFGLFFDAEEVALVEEMDARLRAWRRSCS